ncbi:MAG: hypothetical protein LJE65_17310 [Desulfobacteraceae bacterium]|nr:hypothetical protein [Desulfobacteraceae bacterium]
MHQETRRYICCNDGCADREELFSIEIREEILMDENNIADMYCPRCSGKLTPWTRGARTCPPEAARRVPPLSRGGGGGS